MFCENCKKEIPFLSEMVVCPFCKADIKKSDVVADLSDLVARYGSDAVLGAIKSLNVVKQEELSSLTLPESKNDEVHGTFTDSRDGQVYKTVKIGDQVWFVLHINENQYRIRSYDNNYSNYSPNDAYSIRLVMDK